MLTSQQVPQRIQLLLGMRHPCDLLLGVVNGLSNVPSQVLEDFSETILFWSGFSSCSLVLGIGLDSSIGIKTTNDTVRFSQDHAALLDEWLDSVNQLLFVELLLWLAFRCIDSLRQCQY
jgi:hypothetical protein